MIPNLQLKFAKCFSVMITEANLGPYDEVFLGKLPTVKNLFSLKNSILDV